MNTEALEKSLKYIDSWLDYRYSRTEIPGYSVAIAHKGKVIFNNSYGYSNLETKSKLKKDNLFRIASHSKTFTTTALMILAEENKLHIDDYVSDYITWLKDHKDKRWHKVTVRQLMSHGAGVIRDGLDESYWQLDKPFPNKDKFIKEILESKLVIDNNTKLKYSNYGYTLLGLVIEKLSGMPYNDYVINKIVKPLGLKNTGPEYTKGIEDKLVTGYSRIEYDNKRLPIAQISTYAMSPATGFYSTTEDLCIYFSAQMVGSGKLLSDESKKEMQRIQWHAKSLFSQEHIDYGLGIEIDYFGKRRLIGHGGGFPGQSTKSLADPKDELVVIVLTNCIDGPASWISKGVFGIIDFYQENSVKDQPKHDLTHLEGRYCNLWFTSDIVSVGNKIVSTYPDNWAPLSVYETLDYVSKETLKVIDADSFSSEGEFVKFNVKNGKVENIIYTGSKMWPIKEWIERQKSRKIVE